MLWGLYHGVPELRGPGGYIMVTGGYIMVPGGYINKGVLLSCSGQLKMRPTHTDGDFHGK